MGIYRFIASKNWNKQGQIESTVIEETNFNNAVEKLKQFVGDKKVNLVTKNIDKACKEALEKYPYKWQNMLYSKKYNVTITGCYEEE